jgi:enoyl-CoA hydratase
MAHNPSNQELLVTSPSDGVRVLALNRPAKRNALSSALLKAFLGELASASQDDSVRVIVVTGTTSLFSGRCIAPSYQHRKLGPQILIIVPVARWAAGADIKEMAHLDAEDARACRYLEDLCLGMAAVRKPVLAAVEGLAVRITQST